MTIKEASDKLGTVVTYKFHEYLLKGIVKEWTTKGIIWQVKLLDLSTLNSVVFCRAEELTEGVILNES